MSTGKNILTMSALVSKCDLTLEVLRTVSACTDKWGKCNHLCRTNIASCGPIRKLSIAS
jgi:hypothetical protein